MSGILIKNETRRRQAPRAVFSKIAKEVLPRWDISLVFVAPAKARALNTQLRKKSYVPNVLSYIVGEKSAEIIICPSEAAKQASDFQLTASSFLLLLFIHGALHIKGWVHGAKMEKCERTLLFKYVQKNSDRHRHRHVPGKDGRRRGNLR
jgi:rRNA maturation RNase YbeY